MNIKKILIRLFKYTHKKFNLNSLNYNELNGMFFKKTIFKLLKKTEHEFLFENGLTMRGISFSSYNKDPFGYCLSNQEIEKFNIKKFESDLYTFYENEKEKKVKDYNNIFEKSKYNNYPIWSFSYPWENMSFDYKVKFYPKLVFQNRSDYLNNTTKYDSYNLYHKIFAKSHANQFKTLINIIKIKGFNSNLQRPRVIILVKNDKWKWIMSGQGNHRAYILKFLGYKKIPVEIVSVIYYNKLKRMVSNKSTEYSLENIKKLFNLIFTGENIVRGIV